MRALVTARPVDISPCTESSDALLQDSALSRQCPHWTSRDALRVSDPPGRAPDQAVPSVGRSAGGGVLGGAFDESIWSLPCRPTLGCLLVFSLDLIDEKTLEVSIRPIDLLHLKEHRCLHIRQPNGDGLHLPDSSRSSFSAIASLQNAEIFRQRLLFSINNA